MHNGIHDLTILGGATIVGYYAGRLARLVKLPSLIGYMILGVALGPSLFDIINHEFADKVGFITQIALGFVAFSIGSELKLAALQKLGYGIVSIIFAESLTAFFVVLGVVYLLTGNLPLALIFGAVAPASAPAGTVAVIQEYRAKGNLTKALYAVVGFDDGLAIVIFGIAAALAKSLLLGAASGSEFSLVAAVIDPCKEILLSVIVGTVAGFIFCQFARRMDTASERLIMIFGTVLIVTGLSEQFHLSLILTNMVIGFVLVNTRREELVHKINTPLMEIMPLIFILFFCLAGAHLKISELPHLGIIGLLYILARAGGLIGGAFIGGMIGHVEEKIKKWIGLGILSQAGVAIGLSLIVQQEFGELYLLHKEKFDELGKADPYMNPLTLGATVITTITATCIVFEIVGPILTKIALTKAGEIGAVDRR